MRGAAYQLGINVGVLVLAGVLTVLVQRSRYARRLRAIVARVPHLLSRP
jgi:branched-subunit amino acid ABC-type transport system permease component